MEKCRFCQAELEEDSTVCPQCGKDNAVEEAVAEPAAEATETLPEEAAVSEEAKPEESEEASETEEAEKKEPEMQKGILLTPGKIAVLAAVFVLLVGALIAAVVMGMNRNKPEPEQTVDENAVVATVPADGNPDDVTCKGSYTVSDEEIVAARDTVVATMGDKELTIGQLQVYYWMEVRNFLSNYGSYAAFYGLDYMQSLDTQMCGVSEQEMTWQQFFLESGLQTWMNFQAMASESEKAGYVLEEEYQQIVDTMAQELADGAAQHGFASAEDLLLRNLGAGATMEDYVNFTQVYYQGYGYYNREVQKFDPSQKEIEDFFAEYEAEYAENGLTKETATVDVRHILIMPEGATTENIRTDTFPEEAWTASEAKAQEILDSWLAGEMTEDSFAALANEKSEDAGSNSNGGLYTDVMEGQMVTEFNDWCFDKARQAGDYAIVKTDFGYHIMYFCGSRTLWEDQAKSDLLSKKATDLMESMISQYTLNVDYSAIKLGFVDMSAL